MFYNDDNLPEEKVEEALRKLLLIARRKIGEWLPQEGKAAEVASKLLAAGKLRDDGPLSRGGENGYGAGAQNQNGYGRPAESGAGGFERPYNTFQANSNGQLNGNNPAVEPSAPQVSLCHILVYVDVILADAYYRTFSLYYKM